METSKKCGAGTLQEEFGISCQILTANSRKEKIAYLHRKAKDGHYGDYNKQWGLGVWSYIRVFGYDKDGNERPMSEVPVSEIENMVFSSHSLDAIKMKLKNYAIAYPMMARCLTEKNINTLFESYE